MITNACQRWEQRRELWRPAVERRFDPSLYEVDVASPEAVKAFVAEHHYARTCSPTAHPFGLYRKGSGALAGVAVFGPLPSANAQRAVFRSLDDAQTTSLGRLVLLDEVLSGGESWFVSRCFDRLQLRGIRAVESASDPTPRTTADGEIIRRGHVGTVYQALGGRYLGLTNDASLLILPDGTCYSNKASGKVRKQIQGKDYAGAELVRFGAEPLRPGEDPVAWLDYWRPRLTRRLRHRGNHRYVWVLDPSAHELLPAYGPWLPYPKIDRPAELERAA